MNPNLSNTTTPGMPLDPSLRTPIALGLLPLIAWALPCCVTTAAEPAAGGPAKPAAPVVAPAPSAEARLAKLNDEYGDGLRYAVDDRMKIVFVMGTAKRHATLGRARFLAARRQFRQIAFDIPTHSGRLPLRELPSAIHCLQSTIPHVPPHRRH
ncbi:MAG: hypothetical protein NTW21_22550 [Verrucomicrobia bacterium]|nr:hypothetical protein [Verrucomicrobiota bacterium]